MKNIAIALALFYTWTVSFSLGNLLLLLILFLSGYSVKNIRGDTTILVLILVMAYMNVLAGFFTTKIIDSGSSIFQLYFPYLGLLLIARILADHINVQVINILLWLIVLECFAVIYQYSFGLTGFGYNSYEANDQLKDMLYYTRPNGLSTNSSIVGQKLLFAVWTLLNLKKSRVRLRYFIWAAIMAGMILVFNRTVFVALALSLFFSRSILSLKTRLVVFAVIGLMLGLFRDHVMRQFLRGADSLSLKDLTRYRVYNNGLEYIVENPILGNNSVKYFYIENGRFFHLHNSFLETAASNGLIIFGILLFLLIRLMFRGNLYVLPLLFYSLLQFGIFWGVSFFDILLFVKHEKYSKEDSKSLL